MAPENAVNNGGDGGQGSSEGINPAWNDLLGTIPEDLHSQVTPHLRNWDTNFNNKVQEVQSEWAPFKEFKEAGINPEQLRMGLGVMQAINDDPRKVYDLLAQQFNFGANNGQGDNEPQFSDEYNTLPQEVRDKLAKFDEVQKNLDTLTQWAAQQQQTMTESQAQQQEDAALEQTMSNLKAKYGEFNEQFVLAQMFAGSDPDTAVKEYQQLVETISSDAQRPKAPKILGSGSIVPGESGLDPKKMDSKQTKDFVVQMLMNNAAQNR